MGCIYNTDMQLFRRYWFWLFPGDGSSQIICQSRKCMQLLACLRDTVYIHEKIKVESQAKLTNLVTSYSSGILNIPKQFKYRYHMILKGTLNIVQYYGIVKLSY